MREQRAGKVGELIPACQVVTGKNRKRSRIGVATKDKLFPRRLVNGVAETADIADQNLRAEAEPIQDAGAEAQEVHKVEWPPITAGNRGQLHWIKLLGSLE